MTLAACGTPPGQVSVTLTEPTGLFKVAFGVSVRSSVDLRAGDLQVHITAQGGVDECAFENPGPVFADDVNESPLQYNPDTEPGDVRGLFRACAFEMRHVEEVTARIGGKRLKCRQVDAPVDEDETPEQDEAAQERRSIFDYRGPPPQRNPNAVRDARVAAAKPSPTLAGLEQECTIPGAEGQFRAIMAPRLSHYGVAYAKRTVSDFERL